LLYTSRVLVDRRPIEVARVPSSRRFAVLRGILQKNRKRGQERSFSDVVMSRGSHCPVVASIPVPCWTLLINMRPFAEGTLPSMVWFLWRSRPRGSIAGPCAQREPHSRATSASIQARPLRSVPAFAPVCAAGLKRLRFVRHGREPE